MMDSAPSSDTRLATWLRYSLLFSLLWLLLSQGDIGSWIIGAVVVPLATWCAIKLFPSQFPSQSKREGSAQKGIVVSGLFKFIPFFLSESLRGGWQTALLAIHPQKRICPGFIIYATKLPPSRPRLFFTNAISLMPGTISVEWCGDKLTVHALDTRVDHCEALQQCETKVAALFGLDLTDRLSKSKTAATKERL